MFIQEEIQGKKALVKKLLEEQKLDGIYLKKSSNFAWLTGGRHNLVGVATEFGVAGLLITGNKDYVICNEIEAPYAIVAYDQQGVQPIPDLAASVICQIKLGLEQRKILCVPYTPYETYEYVSSLNAAFLSAQNNTAV